MIAFAGESMARNRYEFFAKTAKEEGYQQIAEIFTVTAENEKEHAETLWALVNELNSEKAEQLSFQSAAPLVWAATEENIRSAIAGEGYEYQEMYPEFAQIAEEEGWPEAAGRLRAIALAEKHHQERYQKILDQMTAGTIFKKDRETEWVCRECGYVHQGYEPPSKCPSCYHDRVYFQIKCEQY